MSTVTPIRPGVVITGRIHRARKIQPLHHLIGLRGSIEGGLQRLQRVCEAGGLRCWFDAKTQEVVIEEKSGVTKEA